MWGGLSHSSQPWDMGTHDQWSDALAVDRQCQGKQAREPRVRRLAPTASGEAWISSADGDWVLNPITSADNISERELWTAIVPSDQLLIEVSMDATDRTAFIENTTLTHINVGYRGFGSDDDTRGTSESCNVDVICPLGDDWRDEIPSVGLMIIGGSGAPARA